MDNSESSNGPIVSTHDLIAFYGHRSALEPEIADYIAAQLKIEGSEIRNWYNNLERKLAATPDEISWAQLLEKETDSDGQS